MQDWGDAASWVSSYGAAANTHIADTTKHITAAERTMWNAKQNVEYIVITEDMCTKATNSEYGVAPYSSSYMYTDITVNLNKSLLHDGLTVQFVIDTALVVSSSYRNVRIRFGTDDDWHPLLTYSGSIAGGNTYFIKNVTTY